MGMGKKGEPCFFGYKEGNRVSALSILMVFLRAQISESKIRKCWP